MTANGFFGAIWDLDGTIVSTERNHFESWRSLMTEEGRDLTYEVFRPTFGLRNDDVLRHHLGFSGNDKTIAALAERKEAFFRDDPPAKGCNSSLAPSTWLNTSTPWALDRPLRHPLLESISSS